MMYTTNIPTFLAGVRQYILGHYETKRFTLIMNTPSLQSSDKSSPHT